MQDMRCEMDLTGSGYVAMEKFAVTVMDLRVLSHLCKYRPFSQFQGSLGYGPLGFMSGNLFTACLIITIKNTTLPHGLIYKCRAQWPRSLRHQLFSIARTLGSWVRIPRGMVACVRLFCVCVLPSVGSGLAVGWSPVQGVLPPVYILRNWKSGQGTTEGP
jgi:hypothetical protein